MATTTPSISKSERESLQRLVRQREKVHKSAAKQIAAVTLPGDLVIDPAAGGFGVLHAALRLGREFIGCDAVAPATRTAPRIAPNDLSATSLAEALQKTPSAPGRPLFLPIRAELSGDRRG